MFCIALGAMGLAICLDESLPSSRLHGRACLIFIAVALSSILWDFHLLRSKHWGAERFLLVNISANAAICIAAISSLVVENLKKNRFLQPDGSSPTATLKQMQQVV